jgi:tetratricopeptide (TPR) repeat protein
VLRSWEEQLGADHPEALRLKSALAGLYQDRGDHARAAELYGGVLRARETSLGPRHLNTLATRDGLGAVYLALKTYDEAEKVLRPCLERRQLGAWPAFNTRSLLGAALAGQHRYAEAEKLLLEGYEGLKAWADRGPPEVKDRLTEAGDRLIELYDAWGKQDRAEEWRGKLAPVVKGQ